MLALTGWLSAAAAAENPTLALRDEIVRLIGTATCGQDNECRVLPLGSKACGGPEAYLAWSTSATDARQLGELAAQYKEARIVRQQRLGVASDCAIVAEPAVRCAPTRDRAAPGRCQTLPAASGAAPAAR